MRAESESRVVAPCRLSRRRGVRVRVGVHALLCFIEHYSGGVEGVRKAEVHSKVGDEEAVVVVRKKGKIGQPHPWLRLLPCAWRRLDVRARSPSYFIPGG